jgi:hypothetical protein
LGIWRKRRRCALFIDFENIATKASPSAIASLIDWLEDGKFDEPGGKRKLALKRIYWNSSAEKHREAFEKAGFEVVLCEKFATLKNGADIRMALDIVETCWKLPEVKEYILFTTDSDFVPVLQRLTEKKKTSAILVNEANMGAHTAFRIYADVLVPLRQLGEASTYARPKKKLLDSLRKPASTAAAKTALNGVRVPAGETAPQVTKSPEPTQDELIALAERAVVRIASRTPKNHIARKDIEAQLQQIREFKKSGAKAYLGKKHYQGLMLEVARRNKRIKVKPGKNLSASVMYVPEE